MHVGGKFARIFDPSHRFSADISQPRVICWTREKWEKLFYNTLNVTSKHQVIPKKCKTKQNEVFLSRIWLFGRNLVEKRQLNNVGSKCCDLWFFLARNDKNYVWKFPSISAIKKIVSTSHLLFSPLPPFHLLTQNYLTVRVW